METEGGQGERVGMAQSCREQRKIHVTKQKGVILGAGDGGGVWKWVGGRL